MKRGVECFIVLGLLFALYVTVVNPILDDRMSGGSFFAGVFDNEETTSGSLNNSSSNSIIVESNGGTSTGSSGIISGGSSSSGNTGSGSIVEGSSGNTDSSNNTNQGVIIGGNGATFSTVSSSGNISGNYNNICSFDSDGWVWCTQNKNYLGFSGGCLLTSFAMIITNAGRMKGTEKNYDPVDVYLANNYGLGNDGSSGKKRTVIAYYYKIAEGFNFTWQKYSLSGSTTSKVNKVLEVLKTNPWGVIIGGSYKKGSSTSTHYIVARLDKNGNLVFDDPAYTSRSSGAKLSSITKAYGIFEWNKSDPNPSNVGSSDWGEITSIHTISPNMSNGVWKAGTWEKCVQNKGSCAVAYTTKNW